MGRRLRRATRCRTRGNGNAVSWFKAVSLMISLSAQPRSPSLKCAPQGVRGLPIYDGDLRAAVARAAKIKSRPAGWAPHAAARVESAVISVGGNAPARRRGPQPHQRRKSRAMAENHRRLRFP